MEAMIIRGLNPTIVTFNTLIYGLSHFSQLREVSKLLDEMQDEVILIDVTTFSILVDAFVKVRRV